MTFKPVPALGNVKVLIFYISNVGPVPTNIAYGIAVHCDQNPPNPFVRFVFCGDIFNPKALVVQFGRQVNLSTELNGQENSDFKFT